MATQILETDHTGLLPLEADAFSDTGHEVQEEDGHIFRDFFFAMLFNLFLVLTGAAGWELWRILR
jgi:hypothetical protein